MRAHFGADAAAPLTAEEISQLQKLREEAGECIIPVPADAGPLPGFKKSGRAADHCFEYRDANGALLGCVLRWDARGSARKEFWPVTFWRDEGGKGAWKLKVWPGQRPLYGLHRLAKVPDALILLVEGEKAAAAVESGPLAEAFVWGKRPVVGVTWPGGAEAVGRADFAALAGRNVVVLPDNDKSGEKAADQLIEMLNKIGVRSLRRWKAPDKAPEGWDIADPIPSGLEPGAIVDSILAAPEHASPRLVMTLREFLAGFVAPEYVVDGILKRDFLYALTAMTGAGKTAIALLIAEIASNRKRRRKLGPHEVAHVRVVYIACENAEDVRERLIGMAAKMDFNPEDLDMLVIDQVFDLEKNMDRIRKEVDEFGGNVGLVFIDTSAAMFQGDDENSNPQMLEHAKLQRKLCDLPGRPCVLSLVHPTKHVTRQEDLLPRGGGAYLNEIDGNLTAWAHGERMSQLHWTGKFRGPNFEAIEFRLPVIHTTKLADAKGRLMPTVMAEVLTDAAIAEVEEKAAFQDNRLLLAIFKRPDGTMTQWAEDCGWLLQSKNDEQPKPNKSLVQRVLKRLTDDKRLKKEGKLYTITTAGKKVAQAVAKAASQPPDQS